MKEFYFVDYDEQIIDKNKFLCIYLFEFTSKAVFKIYKRYTEEIHDRLGDFDLFQDVSQNVFFVIKRNGKLSLDIKI